MPISREWHFQRVSAVAGGERSGEQSRIARVESFAANSCNYMFNDGWCDCGVALLTYQHSRAGRAMRWLNLSLNALECFFLSQCAIVWWVQPRQSAWT